MKSMKWIIGCCAVLCLLVLATLALAETEADRLCAQGDELLKARKLEKALALYQQALDKDWEHCGAIYGQGRAFFGFGQCAKARKMLEDLMAFCPGERRGLLLLGYAQLACGSPEEARKTFLDLNESNPRDVSALVGLGRAEYGCGNRLAGEQYLTRAMALKPQSEIIRELVRDIRDENRRHLVSSSSNEEGIVRRE